MNAKKSVLFVVVAVAVLGLAAAAHADPLSVAGLQSWLDPADTSKITLDGSNRVTNFVDSANASNWVVFVNRSTPPVTITSSGPTYVTNLLNGHPGLKFNGVGNGHLSTNTALENLASNLNLSTTNTELDFFAVVATSTIKQAVWSTNTGAGGAGCVIGAVNEAGTGQLSFYNNTGWRNSTNNQIDTTGAPQILEMVYDGSGATATLTMYKNGNLFYTLTGLAANISATSYLYVGTQGSNGYDPFGKTIGYMGDVLWYNDVLSRGTDGFSGDAGQVGYYLQQKYGITGSYVVPEPSTLTLLAAGLLGLMAYAWRKRK